ncbi:hypothetical protein QJS04_geneDACA018533 [Acorus gramineus]|uniref:Uncharacterized protein n=1 Tax=Acorus gramineus TaxID=55184 RepID=A0AAV9AXK3_ACOGR|nr:hypothetical protein QJS04_geneDACA018533 [Acorus gramineus]
MVMSEITEREPPPPPATDNPPRREAKVLHNFSMSDLKWGNQRLLRCVKTHRTTTGRDRRFAGGGSASAERRHRASSSATPPLQEKVYRFPPAAPSIRAAPEGDDGDSGLEEIRAKLLSHLERAAEKMKRLSLSEDVPTAAAAAATTTVGDGGSGGGVETTSLKPWNLRTRRTACKGNPRPSSPVPENNHQPRSLRLRGLAPAGAGSEGVSEPKKERPRLSVSLTREEIEEDIFGLTGSKPSRRPKKRPKSVQKQLDLVFPGLWLTEVTPEIYKVSDSS